MENKERAWVIAWVLLATLGLAGVGCYRHYAMMTSTFDLAIHDQMMWLLWRGEQPNISLRGLHAFADHFQPLAGVVALFYYGLASPYTLIAVQSALLASGAAPVYFMARRQLGAPNSQMLAVLYTVQPGLLYLDWFDFHFISLFVPAVLWAVWAMETGDALFYGLALVLLVTTTESAAFSVMCMGWAVASRRGWRWGGATLLVGFVALGTAVASLRYLNQGRPTQYLSLYCDWGADPKSILLYLFQHPLAVGLKLNTFGNRTFITTVLGSMLWLPLLSPARVLPCLPFLMGNLLAWRAAQHGIDRHYTAGLLPFLAWASIGGAHRLALYLRGRGSREESEEALGWVLGIAILLALMLGPTAPWNAEGTLKYYGPTPLYQRALDRIDAASPVVTDNRLGPHLSQRSQLYVFPNPFQETAWGNRPQALVEQTPFGFFPLPPGAARRAIDDVPVEFIAMDVGGEDFPLTNADRWYWMGEILRSGRYTVQSFDGRILVLRRKTTSPKTDFSEIQKALMRP